MKSLSTISFFVLLSASLFAQPDADIFDKFKSRTVMVDGYEINVEILGEGSPIFFFAGGPGNSHDYMQGNFGHYHTTHQVVFIDMLGRGMSEDAEEVSEYSVQNDVHVVEEIRKAWDFDKISLVGHSYGTVVAQAYAIKYPDQVDKMVLINGFHSGENWQANCDSYNHQAKTMFPEEWKKVDSLRALGYISSDPVFSDLYGSIPAKYCYYHNTRLKQRSPKTKHRNWNSDVYYAIIGPDADFFVSGSMMDLDFRRKLKDLAIPTLIMAGRYDMVSTPEYAVQYKRFMPQATFIMFEKSGHNPYLEEPKKFYRILDRFLGVERKKKAEQKEASEE